VEAGDIEGHLWGLIGDNGESFFENVFLSESESEGESCCVLRSSDSCFTIMGQSCEWGRHVVWKMDL